LIYKGFLYPAKLLIYKGFIILLLILEGYNSGMQGEYYV